MLKIISSLFIGLLVLVALMFLLGNSMDTRKDYAACEAEAIKSKVGTEVRDQFLYACMEAKGNQYDHRDQFCRSPSGIIPACFERGWVMTIRGLIQSFKQ